MDVYHASVDGDGRLQHLVPLRGTAQFSLDRVPSADIATYTASFLAEQQKAGAMGALSTRDTVRDTGARCGARAPTRRRSSEPITRST